MRWWLRCSPGRPAERSPRARARVRLEAAASTYALALSGATVEGPAIYAGGLTPEVLALAGRELIRRGEALFRIDVSAGRVRLVPASTWTVYGGSDPGAWTYEVTKSGPSSVGTRRRVPAAAVVHFRYAVDPAHPWRGLGPLQFASLTDKLSGAVEGSLGDEGSGSVGHVLPIPADGQDSTVEALRRDLKQLEGETALVEAGNQWRRGQAPRGGGAGASDWTARRFGPDPPAALVELHTVASRSVLAACGVPVELVEASAATGGREAWRRFLFGRVAPLARLLEAELREKVDPRLSLSFGELRASDLAARARAYGVLIGANMDPAEARRHAGFE